MTSRLRIVARTGFPAWLRQAGREPEIPSCLFSQFFPAEDFKYFSLILAEAQSGWCSV